MAIAPAPDKQKAPTGAAAPVASFYQAADGSVRQNLTHAEIVNAVRSGTGRLWVDVDCHQADDWLALAGTIDFHPLTIEDTLSPNSRLKLEEYDSYLFVVARDANFDARTPDPYDFETCNISLYIGRNYLVTVHMRPSRATGSLADRLLAAPELIDRGVDYLAYSVLDTLVDLYFPMLDEIDTFVDEVETRIFETMDDNETLANIFELKRTLLALRRHLAPMREIVATMANRPSPYLQPATQIYIRDVYDHLVRQIESVETYRELLTGALEIHFSVVSNRVNEVMKALAIVSTFLLPGTLVASIYGMNFEWMPMLHEPHGFWFALLWMAGISLGLLWYLKLKRWI